MNVSVCLIRPSRIIKIVANSQKPSAPLGLAYLASVVKQAGHKVTIIDAAGSAPNRYTEFKKDILVNGLRIDEVVIQIPGDVNIIGLSCMFSGNWLWDKAFLSEVRKRFPATLIIAGGEHITAIPEYCLQDCSALDICVLGEGETKLLQIIDAYINHLPYQKIEGIECSTNDGVCAISREVVESENPKSNLKIRINDLDEIPRPSWDLFPIDNYQVVNSANGVFRTRSLPVLASRGCPYTCTFCSSPNMWGTKYTLRDPKEVVNEIESLHHEYKIGNFDFFDLTAIVKKDWIITFAKEIIRRELKITWQIPGGTRAEVIDSEVVHYMRASGCSNITYAPESGSKRLLKIIKKRVKIPNMLTSIKAANKEGLSIKLNIIVGLPDETHSDVWNTIWFLIKCSWNGADDMFPANFTPYPGSELFKSLIAKGKIRLDNDYFDMIVYSYTYTFNDVYSEHLSKTWLRFYSVLELLIFYGTNFLFRPLKVVRLIKNITTGKYESRMEMMLGELIRNRFKWKGRMTNIPFL